MKSLKKLISTIVFLSGLILVVYYLLSESFVDENSKGEEERPKNNSTKVANTSKGKDIEKKEKAPQKRKKIDNQSIKKDGNLNERQKNLLEKLKSKDVSTVSEINDSFPEVSTRTLRRDLSKLEKLGFIKQLGKTKNTRYKYL